ncbi:MAG TPA: SGNH/GDSL hydrolase family protein [Verrucomicrobiae bacterium]|nr:SGNH/GDSL hydrolase family protein [Verrucomicrobiae bacterium]
MQRAAAVWLALLIGGCGTGVTENSTPAAAPGTSATAAGRCDTPTWVGGWATSVQPAARTGQFNSGFTDQTLRMIVRPQAGGSALRLHFSNAYGEGDLTLQSIHVGLRDTGASIAGINHPVTFNGASSIVIPRAAKVVSDPVPLAVEGGQYLAISFHLPVATGAPTAHYYGLTTSYVSEPGDHAADPSASTYATTTTAWFFIAGVDVLAPRATGAVVTLGDSITDGTGASTDGEGRWPDTLAARLRAPAGGPRVSVLNHGIGGNQILLDIPGNAAMGESALARFDRDVLAQTGVTDLVLLEGINDINLGQKTGEQVIAGINQVVQRARARGLNVLVGTLTPNGEKPERDKVNEWIRTSGVPDGVIDFDAAVRDPANPNNWQAGTDNGDNLHGNDTGYALMGNAVDLSLLKGLPCT